VRVPKRKADFITPNGENGLAMSVWVEESVFAIHHGDRDVVSNMFGPFNMNEYLEYAMTCNCEIEQKMATEYVKKIIDKVLLGG
jgi:hypothetical protein